MGRFRAGVYEVFDDASPPEVFGLCGFVLMPDVGRDFLHVSDVKKQSWFELEDVFELSQKLVAWRVFDLAGFDG